MSRHPTFSVVIPAYNRGNLILDTIQSVLAQDSTDFEIVIVDDGSTDDTRAAICSAKDDRIRYIYQANGGGSRARNTGLDAARGTYVAFLDSDDTFKLNHLANALPFLQSGRTVCTYTKVLVHRGDGLTFLKPHRAMKPGEHVSDYLLRDRGFVPTSTLIVPRFLAQAVRYDEQISAGQDIDFAIRLAQAGAEFRMLPEPGAVWNDLPNPGRLSSKSNPARREAWLKRLQPIITPRAYWGDMGWRVAKGYAQDGRRGRAFFLYVNAVRRGCFRPKMAVVILLQVFLKRKHYRVFADALARFGVRP